MVHEFNYREHEDAPIIRLVNTIIKQGIDEGAEQVAVHPQELELEVSYLVGGDWKKAMDLPKRVQAPLVARLKHMADASPAVKDVPQEGTIPILYNTRSFNIRFACRPSTYGEDVEMVIERG